jgi:hypothetical protein
MQGDVYTDKDGHRYIELSRSGDTIRAAMIRDDWPFPSPPVIFKRKDLTKAPSRYLGGAVIDDDKEALL